MTIFFNATPKEGQAWIMSFLAIIAVSFALIGPIYKPICVNIGAQEVNMRKVWYTYFLAESGGVVSAGKISSMPGLRVSESSPFIS